MNKSGIYRMKKLLEPLQERIDTGFFEAVLVSSLPTGEDGEKTASIDMLVLGDNNIVAPLSFVNREKVTIGRSTKCDITLNSGRVSREHAYFAKTDEGDIYIVDNNSSNGVYVRDKKITPCAPYVLEPATQLKFGTNCELFTVWQFFKPEQFRAYLKLFNL